MKLGEENHRIKAVRQSGLSIPERPPSRAETSDDDEGSIIKDFPKNHNSCGACRTRESDMWWKAPKGLPTNVLCDNCGISWRKYADLNVRPFREETISKTKTGDKREGIPLNGNSSKRARVRHSFTLPFTFTILRVMNRQTPPLQHLDHLQYRPLLNPVALPAIELVPRTRFFGVTNASSGYTQVCILQFFRGNSRLIFE